MQSAQRTSALPRRVFGLAVFALAAIAFGRAWLHVDRHISMSMYPVTDMHELFHEVYVILGGTGLAGLMHTLWPHSARRRVAAADGPLCSADARVGH